MSGSASKAFHWKDGRRIAYAAIERGARAASIGKVRWDCSGKVLPCTAPPTVELRSYRPLSERNHLFGKARGKVFEMSQEIEVRCRKCDNCLRAKCAYWRRAAAAEVLGSQRSWFGTLTLRPSEWSMSLMRARVMASFNREDLEALSEKDRNAYIMRYLGPELGKYIKRVRSESKADLRYLLVSERHKSGVLHFHMLLHEVLGSSQVLERTLSKQWPLGFSKWRLVPPSETKHAAYICKYIAKDALTRVRASKGYGVTMALPSL
jgi:hypothetical protein